MTRTLLRWVLAIFVAAAGVLHLVDPAPFLRIMPPALPAPDVLVAVSGLFEVLGGVGLLVPRTRRLASWGLIALFVAVFPANVHMAVAGVQPVDGVVVPAWAAWARLPLQGVLIAWAWWVGKPSNGLPRHPRPE